MNLSATTTVPPLRRGDTAPSISRALAVIATTMGWPLARGRGADLSGIRRHAVVGPAGVPISLLTRSGNAPVGRLVLVHGTPGSADGWGPWLSDPVPGFRVVAVDRPGHGASGPSRAVTSLAEQADLIAGATLPDDGSATVVVGHSLGGAVAACIAARHAERVHALVLVAAALDPELERVHPLQRLARRGPLRAVLPRTLRHANDELLALRGELDALAPDLARIRCPVFVVHGTHDRLVPVANVDYLQRKLVGAPILEVELLRGQDHFLPWKAVAQLRRIVAAAGAAAC